MERIEMLEKIKEIVKPYSKDQQALDNLTEQTAFIQDLKINSANLVDVILDVEEAFDITIENHEMEQMLDVRMAIEIVESKKLAR
jgi:acyl carrier protein